MIDISNNLYRYLTLQGAFLILQNKELAGSQHEELIVEEMDFLWQECLTREEMAYIREINAISREREQKKPYVWHRINSISENEVIGNA